MSETLHEPESRSAIRPARVRSFGKLAELVQRYLGCDAAVLSVDDPFSPLRRARGSSAGGAERCASAAFRRGRERVGAAGIDVRTLTNPVVAGAMGMRFFAGLPLRDYQGHTIGMLVAMDQQERALAAEELETLKLLAGMATDLYEMQRVGRAA